MEKSSGNQVLSDAGYTIICYCNTHVICSILKPQIFTSHLRLLLMPMHSILQKIVLSFLSPLSKFSFSKSAINSVIHVSCVVEIKLTNKSKIQLLYTLNQEKILYFMNSLNFSIHMQAFLAKKVMIYSDNITM